MSRSISNRVVLISGGNTGVGLSIVQGLLDPPTDIQGAHTRYTILMGSRSLDKARAAIDALRADADFAQAFAGGSEVIPVQLDVDDDASIAALVKQLEAAYGRLDILVHNAGP